MCQISYIDILEPFSQIFYKRRISNKLGCDIQQKPCLLWGFFQCHRKSIVFPTWFNLPIQSLKEPSNLVHICNKLRAPAQLQVIDFVIYPASFSLPAPEDCKTGQFSLGKATACTDCYAGHECPFKDRKPIPCNPGYYAPHGNRLYLA